MLIVQPCEFIETGDGYYRMHEPMRLLGQLPGVTAVDVHVCHHLLWPLAEAADVLVLPFFHGWEYFPLIETRRAQGKVTVFETNDYFLDIQPWNPMYRYWLDPEIRGQHVAYIRAADAVQVSCPRLAQHWKKFARRTVVFENHLSIIPPLTHAPQRPLTIGWAGSQGHLADWLDIAPLLERWLDAHPEVHLAVMSHAAAKDFVRIDSSRFHFREAGAIESYRDFLTQIDIGLAPLLPHEYNRCRSDVKFLEYAAAGVVGVYADFAPDPGPYAESVKHGQTGMRYHSHEELLLCLDLLYRDTALRQLIREKAHEYVSASRRFSSHIDERKIFYRSLLAYEPTPSEVENQIASMAARDHNYFALNLDPVDRSVYNAMAGSEGTGATQHYQNLAAAVAVRPNYLLALCSLGRMLNSAKRPEEGRHFLERARALRPDHSATLTEIARTEYLSGNPSATRLLLDEALKINPHYVPAWRYLLNLAAVVPQSDRTQILERLRETHGESYQLALQAAALYEPEARLGYLKSTLEYFAIELTVSQRREAAMSFIEAITKALATQMQHPDALPLLEQARIVFPASLRLGHIYAEALKVNGQTTEAARVQSRLLEQYETVMLVKQEYGTQEPPVLKWQLAQHLREVKR